MSRIVVPIENVTATVTMLSMVSMVLKLLEKIDYPTDNITYVNRVKKPILTQVVNKPLDLVQRQRDTLPLDSINNTVVEYDETYLSSNIDIGRHDFEFLPIFQMPIYGLSMAPLCHRVKNTLNITIKNPNFEKLRKVLDKLRYDLIDHDFGMYRNIQYNYTIPYILLAYVREVYTSIYGTDVTQMGQFINDHFVDGYEVRKNLNGTHDAMIINVLNKACYCTFENLPDKVETSKDNNNSFITFTFSYMYDRPHSLMAYVEKYVNNKIIDINHLLKYGDLESTTNPHLGVKTFTGSINLVTDAELMADYLGRFYDLFDIWHPKTVLPKSSTVLMIPIQVNPNNLYDVMNLNDLVDPRIPAWLYDLFRLYRDLLNSPYGFLFYFNLYEVRGRVTELKLDIDSLLNILSKIAMLIDGRYYLRISIILDPNLLDWSKFLNDPALLLRLLRLLFPNIYLDGDGKYLETIGNGAKVTNKSLIKVLSMFTNTVNSNEYIYQGISYYNIMYASIEARKPNAII